MRISPLETIRVSLDALRANKMRSLLTMLGIVIGIAAVIAMVALGNGAQNSIKERISRLGTMVLQINPQRIQQGGVGTATTVKLTTKDVDMISARAPNVVAVNWQQDRPLQVTYKNKNTNVQVTGTASNFPEVRGFHIATGRMFGPADDAARRKVAVLGADVLPLLNVDNADAIIGEDIRIASRKFSVIGVLAAKGNTGFGDADEQILIPFQTGRFEVFGTDRVNDIWALAYSEDSLNAAMAEIQAAIRRSHKIRPGRPDDFSIRNQSDFLETLSATTQTFTQLLAGIAAVSLLVGGIGIMNIMLVSVTERTREIGVRKALGATRVNILLQFLTEAVVLCLVGGAIGIAAGTIGAGQLSRAMGWKTAVDVRSILVAFAFASGIGVIFGVWPARRASRLDPIEALRYE
ncbi:MAG: ABC transporter permease [Gemmatimonadales bacterium]